MDQNTNLGVRLLVCILAVVIGWKLLGLVGIVLSSPVLGVMLATPVLNLISGSYRAVRQAALEEEGCRRFQHRSMMFSVQEDQDGYRWLRTAEVRQIIPGLPRDEVLRRLFPDGLKSAGTAGKLRIRAELLDAALSAALEADTLKFRRWLQAEIIFPAEQSRRRDKRLQR